MGIAVDDEGNVYVADSGNHRIQIFDYNGKWINTFDLPRKTGHKPSDPTDVAVNSAGDRCYVVDNDNHTILMYNKNGSQLLRQWGERGEILGKFRYPFFISVGQNGAVAVVDLLNTRVQVFDPDGKFIHLVGDWGVDRGEFYRPKGITIDKNNRILVSDSVLGVIQIFDPQGNFLSVLGNKEGEILRFKTPVGIDIDHNSRLYVVEMSLNRVRAFKLQE
jgi:DNA-binding beta-propeller fold protein YncE